MLFKNVLKRVVNKIKWEFIKVEKNVFYKKRVEEIENYKKFSLNTAIRQEKIIVSLTTFPPRVGVVHLVIKTMLMQTVKPDAIILYLDEDVSLEHLPTALLDLQRYGVQIVNRPENIKPHKKYYYAMQENPEVVVITVDDDLLYPNNLIEELYKTHLKFPNSVVASRAHKITFNKDGSFKKYNDWDWVCEDAYCESIQLTATGCGGVLYPPKCMFEDLFDLSLIQRLSNNQDDLWLKVMQVLQGTKVVVCDPKVQRNRCIIDKAQEIRLNSANVHNNQNDFAWNNLIQHYNLKASDFLE